MKQKQYLRFGYSNKKAFIFTLDVAVALVVVFAMLFTASFFVVRKSQDPYPTLQLIRIGSDMVRMMEYKGYLDSLDTNLIVNYLNTRLPPNYGMHITGEGAAQCIFSIGDSPPESRTIVSAKEFFSTNGEYCIMRYDIWLE